MSVESRKVLEMLTEGKITAADAERLLDKLAASPETIADGAANGTMPGSGVKKFLRVMIERPLGADVNVRVPLTFVRSGISLAGVLPPKVMEQLQQEGIDPRFFGQQANDALDELHVDMETKSGKRIRVFCE
ncbi:MAG: hypothetical protein WA655_08085 [Candidatus Korobacteraceae bacterium]